MQAGGAAVTGDDGFVDPRWNWPEYAPGSVVEVRVHGVGGEHPSGMTRDPHPVRVGGDDGVGFWRARNPMVGAPQGPEGRPEDELGADVRHAREVVSWGGSTSGGSRSAFWVLLLPFALFNAAGRMTRLDGRGTGLHQALCRVLALTMTVGLVALTTAVVVDLLALQCAAQPVCSEAELVGRWALAPLREFGDNAAALVGLLALLPVVAVYLLRTAGRRGLTSVGRAATPVALRPQAPQLLDDQDFWANRWPAWRLRGIHITAGYAWALLSLGLVLPPLLPDLPTAVGLVVPGVALLVLLCNVVLAGLPRTAGTAHSEHLHGWILFTRLPTLLLLGAVVGTAIAPRGPMPLRVALLLVLLGLVGLGWSARWHWRDMTDDATSGGPSGAGRDALTAVGALLLTVAAGPAGEARLTPSEAWLALTDLGGGAPDWLLAGAPVRVYGPLVALGALQAVLVAVLALTTARPWDRSEPAADDAGAADARTGHGPLPTAAIPHHLAAPVVALVSLLLVVAVGSGLHGVVLDWLGARAPDYATVRAAVDAAAATADAAGGTVAPRATLPLTLPWWTPWTALVVVVTLLSTGGAVAVAWLRVRRERPTDAQLDEAQARSLAPGPPPTGGTAPAAEARVREAVVTSWHLRRLTEGAGVALAWATLVPTALVLIGVVVSALRDAPVPQPPLSSLWMLVLAAVPLGAVAAIRTARSDRGLRREIGRVWDVLAFWPRTTHPFAPPSYGEALVPAVTHRVRRLLDGGHPVVLAGHSQGSVIVVAAAVHLLATVDDSARPLDDPPPGLHLVTYGSPLRLLYEGLFPAVFGGDAGAIAAATPLSPWQPDATLAQPRTWHNVLALGEPIGTPLWSWSVAPGTVPDGGDGSQPWDVLLQLPWGACPVCGWHRPGAPARGFVPTAAVDITITDPDRLTSPAGEVDGRVAGHSSYHTSRELDLHLHHLASRIRAGV